jgi:hypothetical protein
MINSFMIRSGAKASSFCLRLICLSVLLFSVACQPVRVSEPLIDSPGSVIGTVLTRAGVPATGAYVYAYSSDSKGFRGPADFAAIVDAEGHYTLDVIQGAYHLVARQRRSGAGSGPPQVGDAWAVYEKNPISVDGQDVGPADFRLQIGTGLHQVRQGSLTSGDTGFTGTLTSISEIVEGAFVLAYRSPDFRRMPDFTSLPAGQDGRFVLYVPNPGRYCLAARKQTRGQPREGEPYGTLGPGEAGCRQVNRGEILEVGTITLRPHRR